MPSQTKLPFYQAQILRMWLETPAHHPPAWRFSLEEIGTGSRSGFADLDALIHHLLDLMEQRSMGTQDREAFITTKETGMNTTNATTQP